MPRRRCAIRDSTLRRLLAAGLDPPMGVALWIGDPAWNATRVVITRDLPASLRFGDLEDTIRAVLASEPPQQPGTFNRLTEISLLETPTSTGNTSLGSHTKGRSGQ